MSPPKMAVFGVPCAAGSHSTAVSEAPRMLREAGLLQSLQAKDLRVVNLSDLSLFPWRPDPDHPKTRNAEVVACGIRATADETTRALAEGFTVVLGGGCSIVGGVTAGARRVLGEPVGLVFVDRDADLNTPETTISGNVDGMALAVAIGRGAPEVVSALGGAFVRPEHVALVGYQVLDPGERYPLGSLGLALPGHAVQALGARTAAALALDGVENGDGPLVVHFDADVVDAAERGLPALPARGLSWTEASDLLTALLASPRAVALSVCGYDPTADRELAWGRKLVEVVTRAVGARLKPRA